MSERQGPPDPQSLARAREVLRRHEDLLLGKPNVLGVGIGQVGSECHLVALVKVKLPPSQLESAELIPRSVEGVRVVVREIGDLSVHESLEARPD